MSVDLQQRHGEIALSYRHVVSHVREIGSLQCDRHQTPYPLAKYAIERTSDHAAPRSCPRSICLAFRIGIFFDRRLIAYSNIMGSAFPPTALPRLMWASDAARALQDALTQLPFG